MVEFIKHILKIRPHWADGLLLRADGYECNSYMKK